MLVLSRKVGEAIRISDEIEIVVTEISGDKVKLAIDAPSDLRILRKELWLTEQTNKKAVESGSKHQMLELLQQLKQDKK